MYLVYLDLGYDGLSLLKSKVFKFKRKAERYAERLQKKEIREEFGEYKIMEIEAIW